MQNLRKKRAARFVCTLAALAVFVCDTVTGWEVTFPVLYAVILFAAAGSLPSKRLAQLTGLFVVLAVVSFCFTRHGNLVSGLINLAIACAVIVMTGFLIIRRETEARKKRIAYSRLINVVRSRSGSGFSLALAHELRQPLAAARTALDACSRWLERSPVNPERAGASLQNVRAALERLEAVVSRMRMMGSGSTPKPAPFDMNAAVLSVVEALAPQAWRFGADIATDLAEKLPAAAADRVQIEQVLVNLISNAVDAVADHPQRQGRITLTTRLEGEKLVCCVRDNGSGLSADAKTHLFEPFRSTKPGGTGVGLAVCRRLLAANGGEIRALDPAQGAAFEFTVSPAGT